MSLGTLSYCTGFHTALCLQRVTRGKKRSFKQLLMSHSIPCFYYLIFDFFLFFFPLLLFSFFRLFQRIFFFFFLPIDFLKIKISLSFGFYSEEYKHLVCWVATFEFKIVFSVELSCENIGKDIISNDIGYVVKRITCVDYVYMK